MNENTDPHYREYVGKLHGLRNAIANFLGWLPWAILALFALYIVGHLIVASIIGSFVPVPDFTPTQLDTK